MITYDDRLERYENEMIHEIIWHWWLWEKSKYDEDFEVDYQVCQGIFENNKEFIFEEMTKRVFDQQPMQFRI